MDIVKQLVDLYCNCEYDTRGTLTELEAMRYYSKMLGHGRIQMIMEEMNMVGFIESWRLDMEQLGRVVCWTRFSALEEDVTEGPVAHISDIWVRPDKRGQGVTEKLIDMFKQANHDADYFVSQRVKAKGKVRYIRVYDKANGYKLNKEINNE
jgi:ribosomal protein S18 acetylase RimI-like enzyme